MDLWVAVTRWSHYLLTAFGIGLALWASGHALVYKRDSRAATLWVGLVWLVPLAGAVLYFVLGVNRIRRWAHSLRSDMQRLQRSGRESEFPLEELEARMPAGCLDVAGLARAVGKVTDRPLLGGNRIDVMIQGDTAFPAMLEAIEKAEHSISLSTYIFDADEVGQLFAEALGKAARRGVEVRVLIDATGARYSWPSIFGHLRRAGVRHARFLRLLPLARLLAMNLRNHRKILVVDGRVGFTGGMNIRVGHWLSRQPKRPVQDVHFRVEGPVVTQLQETFAEDWQFTTGEALRGREWFPPCDDAGNAAVRAISDGPDEDFDKLRWTMLAALASARKSIQIATPYFLPEPALIAALNVAALRGVAVDLLLPSRSNLPLVHQASRAHWWQVLEHGCRLWLSPPPFDHSKLMVVDGAWVLVGSANWDPRSLRLNFEFNLECYHPNLAHELGEWFAGKLEGARQVTLEEVDRRGLPVRLMDGIARLFTPFL
jgi:cardiolipin synthase